MAITRIPDKRAPDATHERARVYWEHNLPTAIGSRTILTPTDTPRKTTSIPTNTKFDIYALEARIFGSRTGNLNNA
jgi:hypothetical protein